VIIQVSRELTVKDDPPSHQQDPLLGEKGRIERKGGYREKERERNRENKRESFSKILSFFFFFLRFSLPVEMQYIFYRVTFLDFSVSLSLFLPISLSLLKFSLIEASLLRGDVVQRKGINFKKIKET
jgi:hypothetical protein